MQRFLLGICFFLCFAVTFVSSNQSHFFRANLSRQPDLFFLPPVSVIRMSSLDYTDIVADLIWIQSILYFSNQFFSSGTYKYLETLLNTVTDLDPRFEKAYLWAGSAFIYNGRAITKDSVAASSRLLKKGWDFYNNSLVKWKVSDEFWRLPFMIGFNYAFELGNRKASIPFFRAAAQFSQVPLYIRTLASTMAKRQGDVSESLDALEEQLAIENLRLSLRLTESQQDREKILGLIKSLYEHAEKKNITLENQQTRLQNLTTMYRSYFRDYEYMPITFFQLFYQADQRQNAPLFEWYRSSRFIQ